MHEKRSESSERWHVQHGFNPAQVMTRARLEAAYRKNEISIRALVRREGAVHWQTLGDLLEIDADDTLESISLMPVASDVALPELPKSAPVLQAEGPPPSRVVERPRPTATKMLSLAVALAAGGGVFVGVSAWLGGESATTATAAIAPPPVNALAALPVAAYPLPPPAAPPILEEGSVLVLAKAPADVTPLPAPAKRAPAKKAAVNAKKAR